MMGLNLSKLKKVKDDEDTAEMMDKEGKTRIIIAKKKLKPSHRKQLESLPIHHYAEGGDVSTDDSTQIEPVDSGSSPTNSPQVNQAPLQVEAVNPSLASNQSDQISTSQASNVPASAEVTPQSGNVFQNKLQSQIPGYEEEKAANLGEARALGTEGAQESKAIQDTQNQISKLPTQQAIIAANKDKNDQLFKAYQDQKIDPDHYWENHSKIAAGIGVLLSSVGQAIGGTNGNGALDSLFNGINRDIESQKINQNQKANLWQMNRQALGSDLAANLATQNQLYTGLKYKILQAAANAKSPIALANAQKSNAIIDQQIGANNFKFSLLNPTSDNPDPATRVQFLVPPEKQQKVFSEIDAAKNTVQNSKGIDEAFWQAAKDARPLTGGLNTSMRVLDPFHKTPGQSALIARLGPTFSDIEGTVRQAAMDNMEKNVSPVFGDNDADILSKWKSLQDYKTSKAAASTAKGFGIDLSKFPTTNVNGLRSAAPSQSGPITKGGIAYQQQMINGRAYMVPVKNGGG